MRRHSHNWKGGKPKCLNCGKQLASYYSKRCVQCVGKLRSGINHPMFGKHHSSEVIDKIKRGVKGKSARYWLGKKKGFILKEIICMRCGSLFQSKNGVRGYCQMCRKIKQKEWYIKYNRSESKRRQSRHYFHTEDNRPKYRARWWVNFMVRTGVLIKPKNCEKCGKEHNRLHGHHFAGYEKESRLKINWLCPPCHNRIHLEVVGA